MASEPEDLVVPLSELAAPGGQDQRDARGWAVLAENGIPTGRVQDLMIDTRTAEVHAFVIEIGGSSELGSSSYRVLVPAAQARVDRVQRQVHLDSLSWTDVALLPHYGEEVKPREDDTIVAEPDPVVPPAVSDEVRMTLFGEELDVHTRRFTAGEAVVTKQVEVEQVRRVVPTMREDVVIERRPLPAGVGFEPRVEGDVMYVPLVEEELVIEKRLVAREELVIRKRQVVEEKIVEDTLRREVADVRREGGAEGPDGGG